MALKKNTANAENSDLFIETSGQHKKQRNLRIELFAKNCKEKRDPFVSSTCHIPSIEQGSTLTAINARTDMFGQVVRIRHSITLLFLLQFRIYSITSSGKTGLYFRSLYSFILWLNGWILFRS